MVDFVVLAAFVTGATLYFWQIVLVWSVVGSGGLVLVPPIILAVVTGWLDLVPPSILGFVTGGCSTGGSALVPPSSLGARSG